MWHFIAIPILVALIAITGFAGGAAYYEYNVSGHSWWESKEYAAATFDAGMKWMTIAYTATIVAIEAAVALPLLAAQGGILLNNPQLFKWGIEQMGLGTSEIGPGVSNNLPQLMFSLNLHKQFLKKQITRYQLTKMMQLDQDLLREILFKPGAPIKILQLLKDRRSIESALILDAIHVVAKNHVQQVVILFLIINLQVQ